MAFIAVFSSFFVSCEENEDYEDLNKCEITVSCTDGGKVEISKYLETSVSVLIGSEIEVVATPDENYDFIGWFVGDQETPVSTDEEYSFIVAGDITLTAKFEFEIEAVDLGLPSGIKWAACNVGATKPEEYGGYYAWGETEEKEYYGWNTYKWCNGSSDTITKYCTSSSYGTVDDKTVLDLEDDVAHIKWGGTWRMPTKAEWEELLNNCTWSWTTQNGVNGYKVTGPNGNSIFLPAAGYRGGSEVYYRGSIGYCWSLSLYNPSLSAYSLDFGPGGRFPTYSLRYYGQSVRPVSE